MSSQDEEADAEPDEERPRRVRRVRLAQPRRRRRRVTRARLRDRKRATLRPPGEKKKPAVKRAPPPPPPLGDLEGAVAGAAGLAAALPGGAAAAAPRPKPPKPAPVPFTVDQIRKSKARPAFSTSFTPFPLHILIRFPSPPPTCPVTPRSAPPC